MNTNNKNAKKPLYQLQVLLKENTFTYEEMADKLGMSRTSFSNKINRKIIKGFLSDFSLGELERMAEILNVKDLNIFLS